MTIAESENAMLPENTVHSDAVSEERLRVREAQFRNVSVEVSAWIGKTRLSFGELRDLRPGHVIELDQAVGAPIEIVLNREVVLARGEVVEVGDEYGVRITEIIFDKVV
jgi:flagellar motor switch protein FliN/FliY